MSKFLKFIVNIFLIGAILVAVAILVPPLAGVSTTIVDTPAMKTNLPLGSVTYSRKVDVSELKEGDEVLKDSGAATYAYILKTVDADSGKFRAVSATDPGAQEEEIILRNMVPKVVVEVPLIGYVVMAMQSLEGRLIIGLIVALVIILFALSELWKPSSDEDEIDEDEEEEEEAKEPYVVTSGNENGIDTDVIKAAVEENHSQAAIEEDEPLFKQGTEGVLGDYEEDPYAGQVYEEGGDAYGYAYDESGYGPLDGGNEDGSYPADEITDEELQELYAENGEGAFNEEFGSEGGAFAPVFEGVDYAYESGGEAYGGGDAYAEGGDAYYEGSGEAYEGADAYYEGGEGAYEGGDAYYDGSEAGYAGNAYYDESEAGYAEDGYFDNGEAASDDVEGFFENGETLYDGSGFPEDGEAQYTEGNAGSESRGAVSYDEAAYEGEDYAYESGDLGANAYVPEDGDTIYEENAVSAADKDSLILSDVTDEPVVSADGRFVPIQRPGKDEILEGAMAAGINPKTVIHEPTGITFVDYTDVL